LGCVYVGSRRTWLARTRGLGARVQALAATGGGRALASGSATVGGSCEVVVAGWVHSREVN
jgi:hypothetical protein